MTKKFGLLESCLGIGSFFVLLVTAFVIYLPTLNIVPVLDDYSHLSSLEIVKSYDDFENILKVVLTNTSGPLGRPLSVLSFFITDFTFPSSIESHRLVNIAVHLINYCLFFLLSFKFLTAVGSGGGGVLIPSLVASFLWVIAPINSGPVISIVQRMTSLSSMWGLLSLLVFVYWRVRWDGNYGVRKFWVPCTSFLILILFSVLSKESGVLFIGYVLILEKALTSGNREIFASSWAALTKLAALIYLLGLGLVYIYYSAINDSWLYRDFNVFERLVSQLIIVPNYFFKIVTLKISGVGLVSGSAGFSYWINGSDIFVAVVFWLVLLVLLIARNNVLTLGILWFLNGHALESTVAPLELYFDHRNYTASMAVYVGIAVLFYALINKYRLLIIPFFVAISLISFSVFKNNALYQDPIKLTGFFYLENPKSERAALGYAEQLLRFGEIDVVKGMNDGLSSKLSMRLDYMLECANSEEVEFPEVSYFLPLNGSAIASLRTFVSDYTGQKCRINRDDIFEAVTNVTLIDGLYPFYKHLAFVELAKLYAFEGNLEGAVTSLDSAIELVNLDYLYVTKANWLYSAGLVDDSLNALKSAINAKSSCKYIESICQRAIIRRFEELSGGN